MAVRVGIDMDTGRRLEGWDHVVQTIGVILRTRIGSRVMRRAFGSRVPDFQDASASRKTLLQLYVAVADALRRWEPGYRLAGVRLLGDGDDWRSGRFRFVLDGTYYPRGHLGDFSDGEARQAEVVL